SGNPFTVAFIMEGILDLQEANPKYGDADQHRKTIDNEMVPLLEKHFERGFISIHPYPASAYLSQLVYRVLKRVGATIPTAAVSQWAVQEINRQLALIYARSRNADPLNLAYAVILAASVSADATELSPETQALLHAGLRGFFEAQREDGTW